MRRRRAMDVERRFDLLVAGELNPDVVVVAPSGDLKFGQVETLVQAIRLGIGGSSAIVACGAAKLGLRTAFVGVVGDDSFGRFMLDALDERGIDVSACRVDPTVPTGASVILCRGADRTILTASGAIDQLRAADIPPEVIASSSHLHVGSIYLQRALLPDLANVFSTAQAAGLTTSFDCNWDPTESWDGGIDAILRSTDLFLPNLEEARRITGQDGHRAAAAELTRRAGEGRQIGRPFTVAVKLGAAGGVAVREMPREIVRAPILPVEVADTTGAGDSFDAGFLYGFIAGWGLRDTLDLAVACGSLSVSGIGGTASQPTLQAAQAALSAAGR